MKRLVVHLLIVLSWGIMFNVNANSNENLKQLIENQIEKEKDVKCIPYTKVDPFKLTKLKNNIQD